MQVLTDCGLMRYFVKSAASKPVFGSKEYLVAQYDDIDRASECRRGSKEWRAAERLVKAMDAKKTGAYVFRVLKCTGYDGTVDEDTTKVIAHVVVGLNGPGYDQDYLRELSKAIGRTNSITDVHVDSLDDLWDVLVVLDEESVDGDGEEKDAAAADGLSRFVEWHAAQPTARIYTPEGHASLVRAREGRAAAARSNQEARVREMYARIAENRRANEAVMQAHGDAYKRERYAQWAREREAQGSRRQAPGPARSTGSDDWSKLVDSWNKREYRVADLSGAVTGRSGVYVRSADGTVVRPYTASDRRDVGDMLRMTGADKAKAVVTGPSGSRVVNYYGGYQN